MKGKRLLSALLLITVLLSSCFVSIPMISADEADDEFTAENYLTDFSKYTGGAGSSELAAAPNILQGEFNGSVANIATSANPYKWIDIWSRVASDDSAGGYYLSLKKTADIQFPSKAASNQWLALSPKTYLNFAFDKDGYGIYSNKNSSSALVLKNGTAYSVKVKYRISDLSEGTELQFYAGHATSYTRNVGTKATSSTANDVVLNTVDSNTDGWITEEYIYNTPAEYTGTPVTAVFGWYPVKNGKFDAASEFTVDTDFVEVTRASSVELYSDGKIIDKVYATPGTELKLSDIELPVKAGYKFAGWFTDAELKNPATSVNIVEKNVSAKLYAAWAESVKSAEIDADKYPDDWKTDANIFSGFEFSKDAYTGDNSFSAKADAFMQLCDSDGQPLMITNGNMYLMSFMYKGDISQSAKISFVTAGKNSIEAYTVQRETVLENKEEWTKVFVSFKADKIENNKDVLYLMFTGQGNILIDDIKLATTSKIHFETNGADPIADLEGIPGSDAALSDAVWEGHRFDGWYLDKDFERKCTEIKFPSEIDSVTLYAAWDIEPPTAFMDFENTPYKQWSVQGGYYLSSLAEITESDAFAGKKSLYFAYNGGSGKNSSATNSVAFYNNTEKVYSGENKTYAVSFWYKAKKLDTNVRVSVMTSYQNNWYAKAQTHFAGAAIISKDETVGEWTKKTFYFTSNPQKNGDTIYDFMYLRIDALEDKDAELYIDNITLQLYGADKSLVTLAYDDSHSEYHTAKNGEIITLPTPERENYRFVGWFSDSEYKTAVDMQYKVEGNAVLYAKWQLLSTTMTFDDFPKSWADKTVSGNFKFTERVDLVKDGNNTVVEFKGNKWEGALVQAYEAGTSNTVSAVAGDCYRVKLRYMVKSGSAALRFITAAPNNGYAKPQTQGECLLKSDEKNVWLETTAVFKIQESTYDRFHLSFNADENDTVVYIDDVTIEALHGYSYTEFVLNNGQNPIYSIAKPGDKIVFPTNITRKNYVFNNWFANESLTQEFNGTVTSAEPVSVYAKWILVSTVMKFDDYPTKWADLTIKGNLKFTARAKLENIGGNVALGFSGNNWETAQVQMYEGGTNNLIRAAFGKYYRVSFRYKVDSGAANLQFITAGANNGYAKPKVQGEYELKSYQNGVWKETEYIFKIQDSTYDIFHFKFSATTDNTDVYIDDFNIEMLDNVAITSFVTNNGEDTRYAFGKTGEKFTYPSLKRNGYTFAGWYSDAGLTTPYEGKTFTKEPLTLYAKWVINTTLKVDFEDDFYKTIKSEQTYTMSRTDKYSYDGNYSALMDKSQEVKGKKKNAFILLAYDNQPIELENNTSYIITYKYLALKNSDYSPDEYSGNCLTVNARSATVSGGWNKSRLYSGKHSFGTDQDLGVWMTGSYIITTNFVEPEGRYLYFVCDYSDTSSYCFDSITVEKVTRNEDEVVLNLNPLGATDIGNMPLYYVGKTNKSVTLPTSLKRAGYSFFGWYEDADLTKKLTSNEYQLLFNDKTLYAGWVKNDLLQNFENVSNLFSTESYRYMDMDFEVYNAASTGNSTANVKSGKYSIHRKGNEFRFAAFMPLVKGENGTGTLTAGAGYHMSMWVKMDKHSHTDGAIEIANCNAERYPWSVIGDWKKIYAIKDLADGEWHNITFDFIATASYLSIKTPGNLSIYFDDVDLKYMPELNADSCSKQVEVKEYIPKRNKDVKTFLNSILDTSLIKHAKSAVDNTGNGAKTATKIIIALAAVIGLAGIGGGTFAIVRTRKRKGSSK